MTPLRLLTAAALVAALSVIALPAHALDLGGHDRDGTVVGLNMGAGWSKVAFKGLDGSTSETNSEGDFTGGLSVGWARSDHLMASIGFSGWKSSFAQDLTPATVRTYNFMLDVAWFPRGEGFWVRGGAGLGMLDVSAVLPAERITYQESGFAWTAGAGYELRLSDSTAFGLAYDYREVRIGEFEFLEETVTKTHAWTASFRFYML